MPMANLYAKDCMSRYGRLQSKAMNSLFSISFDYSVAADQLESNYAGPLKFLSVNLAYLCIKHKGDPKTVRFVTPFD